MAKANGSVKPNGQIKFKKADQLIWSTREEAKLFPDGAWKSGITVQFNGKELKLVPATTKTPALKADRKSDGYKDYTAVKYGTEVTFKV